MDGLSELGISMIHAHSPQAKGRIERLFGTFQDRVIKALRDHVITHRPVKVHETPKILVRKRGTKPSSDHPWKKTFELRKKKESSASIP